MNLDQLVAQELGMLRLEVLRLKAQLADATNRLAAANAEVARLSPAAADDAVTAPEPEPAKSGPARKVRSAAVN